LPDAVWKSGVDCRGLGPGSYAGTRIAIATAIGLEASTGARLASLPSICALESDTSTYGVIGDARRQTFFFAEVRERECVTAPLLLPKLSLMSGCDHTLSLS
jgi:tRNA A37 threonylcarbamoyladenosine modification protein TsaB